MPFDMNRSGAPGKAVDNSIRSMRRTGPWLFEQQLENDGTFDGMVSSMQPGAMRSGYAAQIAIADEGDRQYVGMRTGATA